MKILSLLGTVAALAVATTASAQSTATLVSLRGGGTSVIAMPAPFATAHDIFGAKGLDVAFRPFGGFDVSTGFRPGVGFALSFHRDVSREFFAELGLYGRGRLNAGPDGGIFFSIGTRL